jgi:hypothetical protein
MLFTKFHDQNIRHMIYMRMKTACCSTIYLPICESETFSQHNWLGPIWNHLGIKND